MLPWHDVGTAIDRDDVVVAASVAQAMPDHYPVEVWSVPDRALVARFDTVVDIGGRRLALAEAHGRLVVVAAAYSRLGVAGYDAETGERVWHRPDLKRGQRVAPAGRAVTVAFDQGPAQVLDASTGRTLSTLRGARGGWHSPDGRLSVAYGFARLMGFEPTGWRETWHLPIEGFAVLDVAFSPVALLAADVVDMTRDSRCSVYCVTTGELLWHYRSAPMLNCPALGWDAEVEEWIAVEVDVDHGRVDTLIRWSPDGEVVSRLPLRSLGGVYWILPGGRQMVSRGREVIDTRSGQVTSSLGRA